MAKSDTQSQTALRARVAVCNYVNQLVKTNDNSAPDVATLSYVIGKLESLLFDVVNNVPAAANHILQTIG